MTKIINKEAWYNKAKRRWQNTEASKNGVLGGFESVHNVDVENSHHLLNHLINKGIIIHTNSAIDCAAGIGRISKSVLTKYFQNVDILEQDEKFVRACQKEFAANPIVRNIYQDSMQNFVFKNKYDVIWIQWCLEDFEDDGLFSFLTNCKKALNSGGVVIIKDNIVDDLLGELEREFSKIRSDKIYKEIFKKCDFELLIHYHQPNWPKELLNISIFVLR